MRFCLSILSVSWPLPVLKMAPAPALKPVAGRLGGITSWNPERLIRRRLLSFLSLSSFLSSWAEPVAGAMRASRPAVATIVLTILFIPLPPSSDHWTAMRWLPPLLLHPSSLPDEPQGAAATRNALNVGRNDGRSRGVPRDRVT